MTSSSQVPGMDSACSTAEQGAEVAAGGGGAAAAGSAASSATSVSGRVDLNFNLAPPFAAAAGYPYILMSSPSSQTGSADFGPAAYMTDQSQQQQQQQEAAASHYLVQGYIPGIHGSDHSGSLYNVTPGSHYAAAAAYGGGGGVPGFHHSTQGFQQSTQDHIQRMQEHTALSSQAQQNFLQASTTQLQQYSSLQGQQQQEVPVVSAAVAGRGGGGGPHSGQQQQQSEHNTRHTPAPNRRMPNVRQRIRRRTRANRAHIMHINAVAADMAAYNNTNNRDHSAAASYTGSVTSSVGGIAAADVTQQLHQTEASAAAAAAAAMQPEWMTRAALQPASTTAMSVAEEVSGSIGENFECNICFQKANEAVLTCCGHLFCWPCLYRWVHVHSYHKECPVCKGSIAECSITPIYGRESALVSARMQASLGSEQVPPRPQARRIESARQQREREDREREREDRERAIRESEARERNLEDLNTDSEIHQSQEQLRRDHQHHHLQQQQQRDDHLRPGAGSLASPPEIERDSLDQREAAGIRIRARVDDQAEDHRDAQPEPPGLSSRSSATDYIGSVPAGGRYYQRRMAYRREQLRQALASSPRNNVAGTPMMTQNLLEDGQQMLAAAALLSQEWEDIINISHLVVNPVQAAAWLAAMHARLASMEGNLENNNMLGGDVGFASREQSRRIAATGSRFLQEESEEEDQPQQQQHIGSLQADDDPDSAVTTTTRNLAVNPLQAADWLAAMRARLNNIEQIMHNLEQPSLNNLSTGGTNAANFMASGFMQLESGQAPTQQQPCAMSHHLITTTTTAAANNYRRGQSIPADSSEEETSTLCVGAAGPGEGGPGASGSGHLICTSVPDPQGRGGNLVVVLDSEDESHDSMVQQQQQQQSEQSSHTLNHAVLSSSNNNNNNRRRQLQQHDTEEILRGVEEEEEEEDDDDNAAAVTDSSARRPASRNFVTRNRELHHAAPAAAAPQDHSSINTTHVRKQRRFE